jgi:1-acyl-sn-glycerol-3-phosphate acyltransferase
MENTLDFNTHQNHILISSYRALRMALHLFYAVALATLILPFISIRSRLRVEQHWNKGLMSLLNIKIIPQGVAPDLSTQNMMLVANHVSWLDIYLLNAIRPVRFISKLEVRSWPIIGWLASRTGTLFIDRSKRHDTARINNEVSAALSQGGCIGVFPEGTTSDGSLLRPFHASLLQPAVQSQSQVWPVAIRYTHADGTLNVAPAFINDLSFSESLLEILKQPVIYVAVNFLSPIQAHNKSRRELAFDAEQAIANALKLTSKPVSSVAV